MAQFKESEHPRDKDGKFTDKGKENRYKKLYVSLQFFKNKNQKGNIEKRITNETALENMPKEIFGFENGREKQLTTKTTYTSWDIKTKKSI